MNRLYIKFFFALQDVVNLNSYLGLGPTVHDVINFSPYLDLGPTVKAPFSSETFSYFPCFDSLFSVFQMVSEIFPYRDIFFLCPLSLFLFWKKRYAIRGMPKFFKEVGNDIDCDLVCKSYETCLNILNVSNCWWRLVQDL